MNPRPIVCAAIILAVAAGLWWLNHNPPAPATLATAAAPPSKVPATPAPLDPQSPSLHPPPTPPPAVAPLNFTTAPKEAPVTPAPDPANPQAALPTAFADMARIIRSGDIALFRKTYMTPARYARLTPETLAQMNRQDEDPRTRQESELMATLFESLQTQTPTLNADGTEASYSVTVPSERGGVQKKWTFVKVDGRWYLSDSFR